jgi:hypothetical protein
MRIDRRLSRDVLTERQLYFIECWSNFCHKNSPDTDRVGYSNPLNTIRELLFLYEMEDRFSADKKDSGLPLNCSSYSRPIKFSGERHLRTSPLNW